MTLTSNYRAHLLSCFLCVLTTPLCAAELSVTAPNIVPGAAAPVQVNVRGDGRTSTVGVELYFDESRLELSPLRGVIPGASRFEGVYCLRSASNRVSIIRISELDNPLPDQATLR